MRLIDLDEALQATNKEVWWTESKSAAVRHFLLKRPKVDAVEVVRCKDCKHWDMEHCSDGQGWCAKVVGYRYGSWYCAAGKRKDNGKE